MRIFYEKFQITFYFFVLIFLIFFITTSSFLFTFFSFKCNHSIPVIVQFNDLTHVDIFEEYILKFQFNGSLKLTPLFKCSEDIEMCVIMFFFFDSIYLLGHSQKKFDYCQCPKP